MPFTLTKDTHYYLFSPSKRNLRIFTFIRQKSNSSIQHVLCSKLVKGSRYPELRKGPRPAPSLGPTLRISASSHHRLWTVSVSICALSPLILSICGKMCPKLSEKLKRSYFWVREHSKFFLIMVFASLLYVISAYEKSHRNALLWDSRGNL